MISLGTLKSNKDPLALVGLGVYWIYHSRTGFTLTHDEIMTALLLLATIRTAWERLEKQLLDAIAGRRTAQVSEEASGETDG